jgi:hypothetical protein
MKKLTRFSTLPIGGLFHLGNSICRKTEPFFQDGKCCQAEWNAVDIFTREKRLCGHLMMVEPYWEEDGEQETDSSI